MTNKINDKISHLNKCKYIPPQVKEAFKKVMTQKNENDLKNILLGNDDTEIIREIDERFKRTCNILEVTPGKLGKQLDFNPNDTQPEKIDAMFAEVRVVAWLVEMRFRNIQLLEKQNKPQVDILAMKNKEKFAVEVFCSPSNKSRSELINYFKYRANEKKVQLDNSMAKYDCSKSLLISVLNSRPVIALKTHDEFKNYLKDVYDTLKWGDKYYFGILTGMIDGFTGLPDDIIYPMIH